MKRKITHTILSVIILGSIVMLPATGTFAGERPALKIGDTLERFSATSVEGKVVTFYPSEGKYRFIQFFNTGKPYADNIAKNNIVLFDRFHHLGMNVITVCTGASEEAILRFSEKWDISWPLVQIKDARGTKLKRLFNVPQVPFNILIDSKGKVLAINLEGNHVHETVARVLDVSLNDLPMPPLPTPRPKQGRFGGRYGMGGMGMGGGYGMGMGGFGMAGAPVPGGILTYQIPVSNSLFGSKEEREAAEDCKIKLRKISLAMTEYKMEHKGELPKWLHELYPKYLQDKSILRCPNNPTPPNNFAELADPKMTCSFLYEFAPVRESGSDYRTWKIRQLKEFGDKVPVVRCLNHSPRVLSLSHGGEIYFSGLGWEIVFQQQRTLQDDDALVRKQLMQIAVALNKYKKATGALPEKLETLVPKYVKDKSLLIRPDTKKPFPYQTPTDEDRKKHGAYAPVISVSGIPVHGKTIMLALGHTGEIWIAGEMEDEKQIQTTPLNNRNLITQQTVQVNPGNEASHLQGMNWPDDPLRETVKINQFKQVLPLRGQWNMAGSSLKQTNADTGPTALVFSPMIEKGEIRFRAKFADGAEGCRVIFGFSSPQDYFVFNLGGWSDRTTVVEKWKELDCTPGRNFQLNGNSLLSNALRLSPMRQWNDIRIVVNGKTGTVIGYVNEIMVHEHKTPAPFKGRFGLGTWETSVEFDSIEIQGIEELPVTKKIPVTDTYHGVEVTEQYRWLEDWDNETVKQWSGAQNVYARSILDTLPHVDEIRSQVTEIMSAKTVSYSGLAWRNGRLFAIKRQPPKQQPFIIVMDSADDPASARILVDPNVIDPTGGTSMDWYEPSADGKRLAVSLSKGGTESGDVHVYDTTTGKQVHEVIPRVNSGTAGGDLAWLPGGSGFYYTRHPRETERPPEDMDFFQQVYFHKLGTPTENDRYEIGKDFPRIAEIKFDMNDETGLLLATVQKGDGGEFAHYLRSTDGTWRQFSRFGDKTVQATFGPNDDLYVVSRSNAPRGKILRVKTSTLDVSQAETIIPQGKDTIVADNFWRHTSVVVTKSKLYAVYQLGGPSEIRVFDLKGKPLNKPEQLPVSAVSGLTRLDGDDILFESESFIEPDAVYRYSPKTDKTVKTALASKSPVSFDDVEVRREFTTSKDGTQIPLNIILPKNTQLDASNPCIVYGYGGYGINLSPRFSATRQVLFDRGMIYVVANIRGGGEYGEEWHLQGNLTNKQNVFDDFLAAVQHVVEQQYTSHSKLAILGGSNGGLLMGAAMTQRPDLMKAVVSYVGIYDMLRVELSPNGAFNITEFGTVKNPAHFKALYAYSPYHHVKDGTDYPATLFLTGANDPRVDPMQSRKMTARLQAAAMAAPILLRTSSNTGHGGGTALSERIEQTVDVYAFLFDRLNVKFNPKNR